MWVNNLPKLATQWNSGATRESNPGPRARISSALAWLSHWFELGFLAVLSTTLIDAELACVCVCVRVFVCVSNRAAIFEPEWVDDEQRKHHHHQRQQRQQYSWRQFTSQHQPVINPALASQPVRVQLAVLLRRRFFWATSLFDLRLSLSQFAERNLKLNAEVFT